MTIELWRLRQPKNSRDPILGDDHESGRGCSRKGGKVWLLELVKSRLGHGLKRELTLLTGSELKPRKPFPHVICAKAKAGVERFVH